MTDHKKCDSEYQDQLSNTGDSVAAIQEESITEFDDDDSSSFRLYRSGVPTATCGVNAVGHSTQRVRAERNARRFQTERTSRRRKPNSGRSVTTSPFSWTRTSSHRPALEVEGGLLRDARLLQSRNPVSTLRTQSTGVRALSIETSEGQDRIRTLQSFSSYT